MKNQPQTTDITLAGKKKSMLRIAYDSVPRPERTRGITLIVCAAITIGVMLLSRLFWLFKPLLDKIYYGELSEGIYYIFLLVLCLVYCILLARYVGKNCNEVLYTPRKNSPMTITRVLTIIAVCAVAVFITGAAFKFKVKIQLEMGVQSEAGKSVTIATALTNIAVYSYYAFHLWLGLSAAVLVQRGLTILFPAKHTIPWGAIFLVTVYGLLELALEIWTTNHVYPWLYYLFTYVYAAVFILSDYRFHVTYWASIIVMVL